MQLRIRLTRLALFSLVFCMGIQSAQATTVGHCSSSRVLSVSPSNFPFDLSEFSLERQQHSLWPEYPDLPSGTLAEYTLDVLDSSGEMVFDLEPYTRYSLVLSVEDLRTNGEGVFAAFADIEYDPEQVSFVSDPVYGPEYGNIIPSLCDINETPGQLSHVGALAGIHKLGAEKRVVASIEFETADAPDDVFFSTRETGSYFHATLLYEEWHNIPDGQVRFGSWPVDVTSAGLLVPEPAMAGNLLLMFGMCLLVGRRQGGTAASDKLS